MEQAWKTLREQNLPAHQNNIYRDPLEPVGSTEREIKSHKCVVEVMAFCCAPFWGTTSKSCVGGYSDGISQGMAGWL